MFEIDSLLHSEKKRASFSPAFTLVELLLVIVIIAILATITIVAFNGIQDRARASAVSAALNQASKKLELYSVDNGGYPATLSDAGVTDSNNVSYQYTASTAPSSTYCTTATQGSTSYYISNTTKTPTKGGCPGHGQGGVAAITNLATNPRAISISAVSGAAGWNSQRWFGTGSTGVHTVVSGASDGPQGITTYARKTWTTVGTGTGALGFDHTQSSSVTDGVTDTNGITIAANTTYTLSAYLRSSALWSNVAQLCVWWHDSAGVYISKIYAGKVSLPANTWVRLSFTVTSPSAAAYMGAVSDINGSAPVAGEVLDGTGLMITQGSILYSYADGNSTNWVWNGATNNSTSTGPAL